jgi:hypothetical protein
MNQKGNSAKVVEQKTDTSDIILLTVFQAMTGRQICGQAETGLLDY